MKLFKLVPVTPREKQVVNSLGANDWSIFGQCKELTEVVIEKKNHFRRVKWNQLKEQVNDNAK